MNRDSLKLDLERYETPYAEEQKFISRFQDLLFFDNCYERSLLSGHMTGSAWILSPDKTKVLLLHHKKLDRWLQPGGHTDGDENVLAVAKKEMMEESGIEAVELLKIQSTLFFDIDIHAIPARKDVPKHEHFDLRFAFIALNPDQLVSNHESNDLQWIALDQLEQYVGVERSIIRMKEKTPLLHS